MSTEDGPGIRTTVFFKGCSLECRWCHNPESISMHPQVHWVASRCLGCGTCADVCPVNAITLTPEGVALDRSVCRGCGTCSRECPSTAMELLGKTWTLDGLIHEVHKDRAFFETSNGGITVSGGEPCMQATFVEMFLKVLAQKGIHTALDTCGSCSWPALSKLLPHAAMVMFDVKEIDSNNHQRFTGSSNERILENLLKVAHTMRDQAFPRSLWIRTPIIPGMTAREDTIAGIGRFLAHNLGEFMARWELCAFNNLCADKYRRLGRKWELEGVPLMEAASMDRLARVAKHSGVDPDRVVWTGSTRPETGCT